MFNLQGSEIIFILLLALVVLGPEKLPGAIRKFTQVYGELRKMGTGFQTELKSALDEPMREMRETADLLREQADPSKLLGSDAATRTEAEAERMRRERERAQAIGDQRAAERMAPAAEHDTESDAEHDDEHDDEHDTDDEASESATGAGQIEPTERAEPSRSSDAAAATPVDHESADVDEWADPIDLESARERRKNGEASA